MVQTIDYLSDYLDYSNWEISEKCIYYIGHLSNNDLELLLKEYSKEYLLEKINNEFDKNTINNEFTEMYTYCPYLIGYKHPISVLY